MNGDLIESFVEVTLKEKEDFLKIKETLTRIGIASRKDKILYQSCHILHKQGKYYIVHFKELFLLDGKQSDFTEDDKGRRNTIVNLLTEWNLLDLVDPKKSEDPVSPLSLIKIVSFKDKDQWNLIPKYQIGKK
jgi:hypothetical protein